MEEVESRDNRREGEREEMIMTTDEKKEVKVKAGRSRRREGEEKLKKSRRKRGREMVREGGKK